MPTAAIYTRVSTDEQVRHGVSLDDQRARCLDYCARSGLAVARVIVDEGQTSRVPLLERPAGKQLAELIVASEVTDIVAAAQSRLFRDLEEAIHLGRRWVAMGLTIHLLDSGGAIDMESPDGELSYGLKALLNQHEVRQLRKRVKDALNHIAHTGRRPGSPPYGYRLENKLLVPVPEEAAIVREVYRRALAGEGWSGICTDFNRRGVPLKRGGKAGWNTKNIGNMLKLEVYVGKFRWGDQVLDGQHEPLISEDEWKAAAALLATRSAPTGRITRHFTPLFRCGVCGGPSVTSIYASPHKRYAYLTCLPRARGLADHESVRCNEGACMGVLWRHVELLLEEGDLAQAAAQAAARSKRTDNRRRWLQERLEELDRRQLANLAAMQAGALSPELLTQANRPLVQERAAVANELAAMALEDRASREWARLSGQNVQRLLRQYRDKATPDVQMRFLFGFVDHVDMHRGRLVIHHAGDMLPPRERALPRYWAPKRGMADPGF